MFRAQEGEVIKGEEVSLLLVKCCPANDEKGWVPGYTFDVLLSEDLKKIGHLSFRFKTNEDIKLYAGHIGYGINEEYRGNNYAAKACLLAESFFRRHLSSIIITCDPDNFPSIKTIEKLGAKFIETIDIPEPMQMRHESTRKNRYIWNISKN